MNDKEMYMKALERAKSALEDGTLSTHTIALLKDIFPELMESKDEKIRKELIEHIKANQEAPFVLFQKFSPEDVITWLEKQGEDKPADKVKPKFHEGDWVIGRATENEPRQIAEITEEGYKRTYGGWIGFSFEEDMHLWTLEDAKDGNILATSAGAFIYNGKRGGSCPGSYCGINTLGRFQTGSETHWTGKTVNPATNEQRDTLFAKMKEAGYEWDAEKKELKKIEQNPAWSEEDEKRIANILLALSVQVCWDGAIGKIMNPYQKEIDWLKSIKVRMQPKQELSEEDKKMLESIINYFGKGRQSTTSQDNWLKSLAH